MSVNFSYQYSDSVLFIIVMNVFISINEKKIHFCVLHFQTKTVILGHAICMALWYKIPQWWWFGGADLINGAILTVAYPARHVQASQDWFQTLRIYWLTLYIYCVVCLVLSIPVSDLNVNAESAYQKIAFFIINPKLHVHVVCYQHFCFIRNKWIESNEPTLSFYNPFSVCSHLSR